MMKRNHKAWLAAGLLAGAAALTGCSVTGTPAGSPAPDAAQKITAQPEAEDASASPAASPSGGEETPAPLSLLIDGETITQGAIAEGDMLLLPLVKTAEALGWSAKVEEAEEETQVRRSVQLDKDGSRISVSWVSSDNTAKQITWQKDGLLIPVNTRITSMDGVVYVPSAFFETAMRVRVEQDGQAVNVHTPEPQETPPNDAGKEDVRDETEAKENG